MSPREKILKKKQTKGYNPENMEEKTVNDINKGCGNNKVEPQKTMQEVSQHTGKEVHTVLAPKNHIICKQKLKYQRLNTLTHA